MLCITKMEVDPGESEKAKQVEEFAVVDEDAGDEDGNFKSWLFTKF